MKEYIAFFTGDKSKALVCQFLDRTLRHSATPKYKHTYGRKRLPTANMTFLDKRCKRREPTYWVADEHLLTGQIRQNSANSFVILRHPLVKNKKFFDKLAK